MIIDYTTTNAETFRRTGANKHEVGKIKDLAAAGMSVEKISELLCIKVEAIRGHLPAPAPVVEPEPELELERKEDISGSEHERSLDSKPSAGVAGPRQHHKPRRSK